MCTCNARTGRVNKTDVRLPCLGECHNTAHLYVSEESYVSIAFRMSYGDIQHYDIILKLSHNVIMLNISSTVFIL